MHEKRNSEIWLHRITARQAPPQSAVCRNSEGKDVDLRGRERQLFLKLIIQGKITKLNCSLSATAHPCLPLFCTNWFGSISQPPHSFLKDFLVIYSLLICSSFTSLSNSGQIFTHLEWMKFSLDRRREIIQDKMSHITRRGSEPLRAQTGSPSRGAQGRKQSQSISLGPASTFICIIVWLLRRNE